MKSNLRTGIRLIERAELALPWLFVISMTAAVPVQFAPAVTYSGGTNPTAIAFGDLNGDGNSDAVVANHHDLTPYGSVAVLLGHGNGTFMRAVHYEAGVEHRDVVLGDFNGDERLDIVTIGNECGYWCASVRVLLGNGDGTFAATRRRNLVAGAIFFVAAGDLNHDGKLDLVTGPWTTNAVCVLLGTGDGTFAAVTNFAAGINSRDIAAGDVDCDGRPDIAVVNHSGENSLSLLLNTTATTPDHPLLEITRTEQCVAISWPKSNTGFFRLQSSTDLLISSGWTLLTNVPWSIDSQNVVTNAIGHGSQYYRLRGP